MSVPVDSKTQRSGVYHTGRSQRILLVDDDEDTLELMALVFAHAGHVMHTANSGENAVAAAKSFRPHFAFIDISLRGMSGYELVALLLDMPELASCRFIAVTGYAGQDALEKSLCAGFHQHLTKPVPTEALLAAVAPVPATAAR